MMEARNLRVLRTFPLILFVVLLFPFAAGKFVYADDQLPDVGAIGDSMTDEYRADDNRSGLCCVEQAVSLGKL